MTAADRHGNRIARDGVHRCWCGCKYWEDDRCIDCGGHVLDTAVPGSDIVEPLRKRP